VLDSIINPVHLMIIMAVVVVLFGPKRLPEMGQKIGQALREFRSATSEIRAQIGADEIADSMKDLKSTFSLTADSPRSAAEIVADAPAADAPAAGSPAAGSQTAGELAAESSDAPAEVASAAADVPIEAVGQRAGDAGPAAATNGDDGVEAFGGLKRRSDAPSSRATVDDGEGGVEAFGSLKRRSASSPTRAHAD
jgi:TatA/E family protein of Tat protein translocase